MARTRDPFSVLKMKDTFDDCSETLYAAIRKQNPDINQDAFDMALRQLVISHGSSLSYSGMNGIIASIQEPAPMYIEAADVLVLARKAFTAGDLEESLKLFALSNDSDNADDLYDALALNNSKSEVGVIHASTVEDEESEEDENEDGGSDGNNYDVEDDDTPLYDLRNSDDENGGDYSESDDEDEGEDEGESSDEEEDDDEDEEVESVAKVIARSIRLHAEEDEVDNTSDDKTDTADDETEENEPNGGTSSGKFNANTGKPQSVESINKARMQRIAANKVSLNGTDASLAKAGRLQLKRAG